MAGSFCLLKSIRVHEPTLNTSSTERNTDELRLASSSSREAAPRPRLPEDGRGGGGCSDGFGSRLTGAPPPTAAQRASLPDAAVRMLMRFVLGLCLTSP